MKIHAEGGRVAVRPILETDLGPLMAVNGDDEVTRYLPYRTWRSESDAHEWYDRMMSMQSRGHAVQLVLVDKATRQAIGTCLLFRFDEKRETAELGYTLARGYWGRGYMHEALSTLLDGGLGLKVLDAVVDLRNEPSWRLLQRLGFTRAGETGQLAHWKLSLPRPGSAATTPAARRTPAETRG